MEKTTEIARLDAQMEGVPYANEPLYWDRRLPVATNLATVERYLASYQSKVPAGCVIDEVAVLAPNAASRTSLIEEMALHGWEQFNRSADLVHANPFGTRYAVEYVFLRHPDKAYRLEVMLLGGITSAGTSGFSPLHQALWLPDGVRPPWAEHPTLPVPHLSFKPDPERVATFGPRRAVRITLDEMREQGGYLIAQACQSSYGEFWYLIHQDARRQLYIKPRINTRDA